MDKHQDPIGEFYRQKAKDADRARWVLKSLKTRGESCPGCGGPMPETPSVSCRGVVTCNAELCEEEADTLWKRAEFALEVALYTGD